MWVHLFNFGLPGTEVSPIRLDNVIIGSELSDLKLGVRRYHLNRNVKDCSFEIICFPLLYAPIEILSILQP